MAADFEDADDVEEQRALALQFEQPAKKGMVLLLGLVLHSTLCVHEACMRS
jgi:hypothetical protein